MVGPVDFMVDLAGLSGRWVAPVERFCQHCGFLHFHGADGSGPTKKMEDSDELLDSRTQQVNAGMYAS